MREDAPGYSGSLIGNLPGFPDSLDAVRSSPHTELDQLLRFSPVMSMEWIPMAYDKNGFQKALGPLVISRKITVLVRVY